MNNTTAADRSRKLPQWFPWAMALIACLSLLVSNGMTITGLSVHDNVLLSEFGWSRAELKFRDMITLGLTGLFAPLAGVFIDKFGVRRCMIFGWLVLAIAYFGYSIMETLWHLYVIHALFAITLVFCGLNVAVILVSKWFVKQRGAAIGLALVGTSLGGILFPQYGVLVGEALGWRQAFAIGTGFTICMLLLSIFIVRDGPGNSNDSTVGQALPGMAYGDALRTPAFWAISVIAMFTFYTVLGTQAHLFLYLQDLEYDRQYAANMISIFFFCALIGKFVFGLLTDYLAQSRVFIGNLCVMFCGALALALMKPELILPAVLAFGLGWGGAYTVLQLTVMNYFGLRSAGKILGTITVLDAFGGGLGIWLTGLLYDRYGNYQLAFTVFAVLVFIALICTTLIGRDADNRERFHQ